MNKVNPGKMCTVKKKFIEASEMFANSMTVPVYTDVRKLPYAVTKIF